MKSLLASAVILAASGVGAMAQTATPGIDARQTNQAARIEAGKTSGQLTDKEATRLENGQKRVQAAKDAAAADGKVTAAERARINNMQDRQSARIARQKHDAQTKN